MNEEMTQRSPTKRSEQEWVGQRASLRDAVHVTGGMTPRRLGCGRVQGWVPSLVFVFIVGLAVPMIVKVLGY